MNAVGRCPRVSVVMPAFNQAKYVGDAVRSVIDQTCSDWELVVVDDGSSDATAAIVEQWNDARIRVVRQTNSGTSAARNVGIAETTGEYVAFLDGDDLFAPAKLAAHVAFLDRHPHAGLSYGARVEIDETGRAVGLARLPESVSLTTILLEFPFAPSDIVVRRRWLGAVGGFRPEFVVNEDRDLYVRLALAGCECAALGMFLSFRRLHRHRTIVDLPARMSDMKRALATAFDDPRCPADVLVHRREAHRRVNLAWAYQAAVQEEATLARRYALDMLADVPRTASIADSLARDLVHMAIRDGGDHRGRIRRVFGTLSNVVPELNDKLQRALSQADLLAGIRVISWGGLVEGQRLVADAAAARFPIERRLLQDAAYDWLSYRIFAGSARAQSVLDQMVHALRSCGLRSDSRWFEAACLINAAFDDERLSKHEGVPAVIARAITRDPAHLVNRGVWAILARSVLSSLRSPHAPSLSEH